MKRNELEKQVYVVHHVPFENLGNLQPILEKSNINITYSSAVEFSMEKALESDLLIVLGAPLGIAENNHKLSDVFIDYPFLKKEIDVIKARIDDDLPTLGICFGAQLIAYAMGARVYSNGVKEIGWYDISLSDEGCKSALQYFEPPHNCLFHWHGDTFELPKHSILLASSQLFENQAFSLGNNILALQFHPEVTVEGLELWYIGHALEIELTKGINVQQLREKTQLHVDQLKPSTNQFWHDWLRQIKLFD